MFARSASSAATSSGGGGGGGGRSSSSENGAAADSAGSIELLCPPSGSSSISGSGSFSSNSNSTGTATTATNSSSVSVETNNNNNNHNLSLQLNGSCISHHNSNNNHTNLISGICNSIWRSATFGSAAPAVTSSTAPTATNMACTSTSSGDSSSSSFSISPEICIVEEKQHTNLDLDEQQPQTFLGATELDDELIKQLPKEVLLRVFSYLDVVSLCRCAQVCKYWNVLALDGSSWQKINLFDFQRDIEGPVIENISQRCGGFLKSLSLRGCQSVGDQSISKSNFGPVPGVTKQQL